MTQRRWRWLGVGVWLVALAACSGGDAARPTATIPTPPANVAGPIPGPEPAAPQPAPEPKSPEPTTPKLPPPAPQADGLDTVVPPQSAPLEPEPDPDPVLIVTADPPPGTEPVPPDVPPLDPPADSPPPPEEPPAPIMDPPPEAQPPTPPDDPLPPEPLASPSLPIPHFEFTPGLLSSLTTSTGAPIVVLNSKKQLVKTKAEFDSIVTWQAGRAAEAPLFANGYLVADPQQILPLQPGSARPLQAGTIALWIATRNFYGAGGQSLTLFQTENIVIDGKPSGADFALFVTPQQQLQFFTKDTATAAAPTLATPIAHWAAHESHHVALTWAAQADGTVTYRLYLDGRIRQSKTSALFPTGQVLPKQLSLLSSLRWSAPAQTQVALEAFATYADALDPSRIAQLYAAAVDTTGPTLRAGRATLQLTGPHDGLGLLALADADDPARRKTIPAPPRSLWRLRLQSRSNPAVTFTLSNTATQQGTTEVVPLADGRTRLQWSDITLPTAALAANGPGSLAVDVTVTPVPNEDEFRARLHVTLDSTEWQLTDIAFPVIEGLAPPQGNAATAELVRTGPSVGSLLAQPFTHPLWTYTSGNAPSPSWDFNEPYPSGQMPMPWFGLRDTATPLGGWYFGVHDPSFSLKRFALQHLAPPALAALVPDAGLDWIVTTSVPRTTAPTLDFTLPGIAILRVQDGDWFPMAQRYRTFLTALPELQGRTFSQRATTDLPLWLVHAGVLHTGSSYNEHHAALVTALAQQNTPAEAIVWHYNMWQQGAFFTPPDPLQPGKTTAVQSQMNDLPHAPPAQPNFATNLQQAATLRIPTAPYTLPRAWDILLDGGQYPQTPSQDAWQTAHGELAAMRDARDDILMYGGGDYDTVPTYNPQQPKPATHFVTMCPRAPLWQQQLRKSYADLVAQPGPLVGVYADLVARDTPTLCFGDAAAHHHVAGDPASYARGWRTLFTDARTQLAPLVAKKFSTPQDPLARPGFYTEGFSDPYLGAIDGYLMEYMPPWETTIPIAPALAHDYAVFLGRGTQSKFEPLETMIAKQGQIFSWGMVPGYVTYGLAGSGKLAVLRDYLGTLAAARRHTAWRPFLSYGRMLSPPPVLLTTAAAGGPFAAPTTPLPGAPFPTQTLPIGLTAPTPTLTVPLVSTTAWRHGTEARAGIVLASLETATAVPPPPTRVVFVPLDRRALGLISGSSIVAVYEGTALRYQGTVPIGQGLRLQVAPQQVYLIDVR